MYQYIPVCTSAVPVHTHTDHTHTSFPGPFRHHHACDPHESPSYACPTICEQNPASPLSPRLSGRQCEACHVQTRKNHFIPCDEQTKSGNFTTKIRKFFRFHCVRAASNPFRLVLDTVTPCTAVHGSPRPLYPSSFKCAPAFTPVRSRDLPGGPGCAHGSS